MPTEVSGRLVARPIEFALRAAGFYNDLIRTVAQERFVGFTVMNVTALPVEGIRIAKGDGWLFVVLLLGIAAIGEALKLFRAPALLLIVLIAIIYARETIFRRQYIPLMLLSLWGLIYVVLSYLHAFPTAWTRYHDTSVILQQASFLATLLPMVAASQKWWDDARFDANRDAILIAIVLVAFVLGALVDIVLSGDDEIRPFVTMRNYVFIGLLALSYLAFRHGKWRRLAILALVLLAGAAIWQSPFVQNKIVYVLLLVFLATSSFRIRIDRMVLFSVLFLVILGTLLGLQDPLRIFELDSNIGWRFAWWNDALAATVQTNGIGVGFGTEALRNEYTAILHRDRYDDEDGAFLLISTHSAFFDIMFRTGIVGIVLLFLVLSRCFPHPRTPLLVRAHCCAMFAVLIVCLHSNLGLQSPMYALGVAICIGYLQFERRRADAGS